MPHKASLEQLLSRPVSRETVEELERYLDLIMQWNRTIRLVGEHDREVIWQRHILDSAQLLLHIDPQSKTLLDLGSGAGFPGIVLACLSDVQITLLESDQRKAVFLEQAAAGLRNAPRVWHQRIESAPSELFDVITARALASSEKLMAYARPFCHDQTVCLWFKGEHVKEEIAQLVQMWQGDITCIASRTHARGTIVKVASDA
jgi:16S rRNA (guanine527-N7)-methyltransferase